MYYYYCNVYNISNLCPLVYLKAVGQYDIRIHSPNIKMINEWMLKTLWSLLECD